MAIPITCPGCQAAFEVPDTLAGKTIRCTSCKTQLTVPTAVAATGKKPFGSAAKALDEDEPPVVKPVATPTAKAAAKPAKAQTAKDDEKTSPNKPAAKTGSAIKGAPKKRRDDDDDDDDDDQPRRKKKKNSSGGSGTMVALIGGGVVCLGAIVGLSVWLLSGDDKKDSAKSDSSNNSASTTPTTGPGPSGEGGSATEGGRPGGGRLGGRPGNGSGGGRPNRPQTEGASPSPSPGGGTSSDGASAPVLDGPGPGAGGGTPPIPGGGNDGPGGPGPGAPGPGPGVGQPAPGRPPMTGSDGRPDDSPQQPPGGAGPGPGGGAQPPPGGEQPPIPGVGQPPFPGPGPGGPGPGGPGGGRPPGGGAPGLGGIGFGGGQQADPNPPPFGANADGKRKANLDPFYAAAFDKEGKEFIAFSASVEKGRVTTKLNRYDVASGFSGGGAHKVPHFVTRATIDPAKGLLYVATMTTATYATIYPHRYDQVFGTGNVEVYDLNALRDGKVAPGVDLKPIGTITIGTGKTIRGLELTPDSKTLVVLTTTTASKQIKGGQKSFLHKFDTETRKPAGDPIALAKPAWDMHKSTDGKLLVVVDMPAGVGESIHVRTFNSETLTGERAPPLNGTTNDVGMAPGGQVAGVVAGPGGSKLVLVTPEETRDFDLGITWKAAAKPGFVKYSPDGKRLFVSGHFGMTGNDNSGLDVYEVTDPNSPTGLKKKASIRTAGGIPVGGHFLISPDGEYIAFHSGAVLATSDMGGYTGDGVATTAGAPGGIAFPGPGGVPGLGGGPGPGGPGGAPVVGAPGPGGGPGPGGPGGPGGGPGRPPRPNVGGPGGQPGGPGPGGPGPGAGGPGRPNRPGGPGGPGPGGPGGAPPGGAPVGGPSAPGAMPPAAPGGAAPGGGGGSGQTPSKD